MKTIAVISGSLRNGSYSTLISKTITNMLPEGYEGKFVSLQGLNLYNEDLDTEDNTDPSYTEFRNQLDGVSGIILVTPEYNRGTSAALKNAIDVGSRPYGQSKWDGIPVGIISQSPSRLGGYGANHQLRQSFVFLDSPLVQQPEAYVSFIANGITDGKITDDVILETLQGVIDSLVRKIELLA